MSSRQYSLSPVSQSSDPEYMAEPSGAEAATPSRWQRWGRCWSQGITLVIVFNLVLVLFNLTYVPLRQLYLQYLPQVVQVYDPIKGIEPHPVTQSYLATMGQLRSQIAESGLTSATTQDTLAKLREYSVTLVDENPFLASGQITSFARLKRRMRRFTGAESAQLAFNQFWRADYLMQIGWPLANQFLQQEIAPLLQQNYFRETLPTGQYIDNFWRIDLFFIGIFGAELLLRTLAISRVREEVSWGDALARRWYELPLLLPFWRWLRLLPAAVRLHRTRLLNVEKLMGQITHEPAAYLADRVSKYVMVRLINQTQTSVRDGTLMATWNPDSHTRIGDPDKLDRLSDRLLQLILLRVMPTIKPNLEELLRHSMQGALTRSQLYDGLRQLPGFATLPTEALDGVADYLAQATCDVLADSYTDQEGRMLLDHLSRDFRQALAAELREDANAAELQTLLFDLLEELKVNYVQRSEQYDPEATLQEVDELHESVQGRSLS